MRSAAMQIRPVKTEEDHDAALARIQELMQVAPDTPESDELEVLITLVEAYESKHFPMNTPDPISMILFRMDQQGLTRKELEPMIGSRARVSEVLSRKRNLTLRMIRRLSAGLQIPADLLIALPAKKSELSSLPSASGKNVAQRATRGSSRKIAQRAARTK